MIDVKKAEWETVISALKKCEDNPVYEEKAEAVISPNRLDIVIRELALSELAQGISGGIGLSIYNRWLFLSHGTKEATKTDPLTSYFSDYSEKNGFENYCSTFLKLYESIKEDGFDPKKYIPLDGEHNPINGAHRLAVALYIGSNVFVKDYTNIKTGWRWNCKRLSSYFSETETLFIIEKYIQHKKNCYLAIIPRIVSAKFTKEYQKEMDKLESFGTVIGAVEISDSKRISREVFENILDYSLLENHILVFLQCSNELPKICKREIENYEIKCLKLN